MNEQLQQQLMELVYGLLDEDETNALCEQITSDPQMARAYAKVKLQCDLVGRAARIDTPNAAWFRPDGVELSNTRPQAASKDRSESGYGRLTNWCIGVAASGLIFLVGSSYFMSSGSARTETSPVAAATIEPVQVVLTGPSKLHSEANNPFTVHVENQAGTPVSTTLNYRVYDATGAVAWQDAASTDKSGTARFDVGAGVARQATRLVVATDESSQASIQRELETAPDQFVTYLRMDRPLYQPGDRVEYRSVTLSRYALQSEDDVTTSFDDRRCGRQANSRARRGHVDDRRKVWVTAAISSLPSDLPDGDLHG